MDLSRAFTAHARRPATSARVTRLLARRTELRAIARSGDPAVARPAQDELDQIEQRLAILGRRKAGGRR